MNQENEDCHPAPLHEPTHPTPLETRRFAAGSRILAIVPARATDWTSISFVIDDDPGDVVRAVVDLDGHVELYFWSPQNGNAGPPNAIDERDWDRVAVDGLCSLSPTVRALREYLTNLSVEEIREIAHALVEQEHVGENEHLESCRALFDLQVHAVDLLERRLAVLGIADPEERAVALRLFDDWTHTPSELVTAASGITA